MALTVRNTFSVKLGMVGPGGDQLKVLVKEIDFDSSYPTGGEALDLSAELPTVLAVIIEGKGGYEFSYDYANKKVLAYWGDYSASADAVHVEVANTTSMSAVTGVRIVALGY